MQPQKNVYVEEVENNTIKRPSVLILLIFVPKVHS